MDSPLEWCESGIWTPGLPAHISDPWQLGVDCHHVVDPYGPVTLRLILPKKATIEP